MVRSLFAVSLLILLSACAGGHRGGPHAGARWDGWRGYDGRGLVTPWAPTGDRTGCGT